MARRRIELPDAEVLFGDGGPKPSRRKSPSGEGTVATPSGTRRKAVAPAKKAPPTPKPATTRKKTAAAKPATTRKKLPAPRKPRTTPAARKSPAARKPAPPPRRSVRSTPAERLELIESQLADLPVDALIDLRDGLEELLSADEVDDQAVRRLLDAVEV